MPFIALNELPKMELFPGVRSALAAGSQLMLSALEMEPGGVVPEHSHPPRAGRAGAGGQAAAAHRRRGARADARRRLPDPRPRGPLRRGDRGTGARPRHLQPRARGLRQPLQPLHAAPAATPAGTTSEHGSVWTSTLPIAVGCRTRTRAGTKYRISGLTAGNLYGTSVVARERHS